jgi:hypothetical protein
MIYAAECLHFALRSSFHLFAGRTDRKENRPVPVDGPVPPSPCASW